MIFNFNTDEFVDKNNCYRIINIENIVCYYNGFIYHSGNIAGEDSIKLLINNYLETSNFDFNFFYGTYHIIIKDINSNKIYFFGDNSGSCCFYYNSYENIISDSFLEIAKASNLISPDYYAITEFIHFNCIYSNSTIIKEIFRTEALKYYEINASAVFSNDKNLSLEDNSIRYNSLHQFMSDFVYASDKIKTANIITGGTDSRTVLAHLISLKKEFELVVSGNNDMIDVQIAKQIADKLNKKIYISDEHIDDEKWLVNLFINTDGVTGTFSKYRLYKMNAMLKNLNFDLICGGLAGEFYKNSFLNQDFPFYLSKKININKFYSMKVYPNEFNESFFTKEILDHKRNMKKKILNRLFDDKKDKKYKKYFRAGTRIMKYRMITLSNHIGTVPLFSPLVEIDVQKLVYGKNPWKYELNNWHRKEVSKYCSDISNIKTDRGVTLNNNIVIILKEIISSYLFLVKVGLKRTILKHQNNDMNKRLEVFTKGRNTELFKNSMLKCIDLQIINNNTKIEEIPDSLADRLMTIGLTFMYVNDFNIN